VANGRARGYQAEIAGGITVSIARQRPIES
jgi:hypothetical protein